MTKSVITLVGLTLLATSPGTAKPPEKDPPIACTREAAGAEHADHAHRDFMDNVLLPAVKEVRPLATGYAFRLPASDDMLAKLAGWVADERKCCGFMTFVIRVDGGDSIWIELTGPKGTKEVLSATFRPSLEARGVAGAAAQ